jgi:maltose O-acetyltransferase
VRISLIFLPDAPVIMRFRGFLYSLMMKNCGRNFQVASSAVIRGLEKLVCGDDVYFGPGAFVLVRESIVIESEVLIAMNVVIVDGNHGKDVEANSYRFKRGRQEPIIIGRGAWIAANSVILAGSIVEAGMVVPPCTVIRREKGR